MQPIIDSWKCGLNFEEICYRLRNSPAKELTPISEKLNNVDWAQKSKNVYHVSLKCGLECIYRPFPSTLKKSSFDTTVLAYQLSQILGLDVVPPAVERHLSMKTFEFNSPSKGSLQLFIPPSVWRLEDQTYKYTKSKTKAIERNKVELFQFIAGMCDRHRGNCINDLSGNIVLIDVGDMSLPKMIIRGHWEFWFVGSLTETLSIGERFDFEKQPVRRIRNPTLDDLRLLFRPFVAIDFIDEVLMAWARRINNCPKNDKYIDFILWENCLWVSCPRNNYEPINAVEVPNEVMELLSNISSVDLIGFEKTKYLKLVRETILYRIRKIVANDNELINVEEVDNSVFFESLFFLQNKIRELVLESRGIRKNLKYRSREIQTLLDENRVVHERQNRTINSSIEQIERLKSVIDEKECLLRKMREGFLESQKTILRLKSKMEVLQSSLEFERAARGSMKTGEERTQRPVSGL